MKEEDSDPQDDPGPIWVEPVPESPTPDAAAPADSIPVPDPGDDPGEILMVTELRGGVDPADPARWRAEESLLKAAVDSGDPDDPGPIKTDDIDEAF
jgi:hypothetical protein